MAEQSEKQPNRAVKVLPYRVSQRETRYQIVDTTTGEVLDDAQGYGYKTAEGARKAWWYKQQTAQQRAEHESEYYKIASWCKHHRSFVENYEEVLFDLTRHGDAERGIETRLLQEMLDASNLTPPTTVVKLKNVITGERKRPKRRKKHRR